MAVRMRDDSSLKRANVDVNKLFQEIASFCALPPERIEPLPPLTPLPTSTDAFDTFIEPPLPVDLFRGLGTKRRASLADDLPKRNKFPKTRQEVTALFTEIQEFCRVDLPFKLNDLGVVDRIEEVTKPLANSVCTSTPSASVKVHSAPPPQTTKDNATRSSTRIALKLIQPEAAEKKQEGKSFVNLMFNFSSKKVSAQKNCASTIHLPKGISALQVDKVVISRKSTPVRAKAKVSTAIGKAPPASCPPSSPLSMFGLDLLASINSCRSQMNTMKQVTNFAESTPTQTAKPKRRTARARRQLASKDDSIESGYSSSQSSVPSPASSLLSFDLLDTAETASSIDAKSSSFSVASSECSFHSSVNPSGEVVYLRSQYDYYRDKFTKTAARGSRHRLELMALQNDHVTKNVKEEQLDFDCLADFNLDDLTTDGEPVDDQIDLKWLDELSLDSIPA